MQFGLLGNLKGFDLVAGGRERQRRPRLRGKPGRTLKGSDTRKCDPFQGQNPCPFAVRGCREVLAHGY